MNKIIFIATFYFLTASIVFAQSNPIDKKMAKAHDLIDKGKIADADEYMVKLLEENPGYGAGWDYLCKIRYKEYQDSKLSDNILGGNVTITTKNKDGKIEKAENDSLAKMVMEMLNNVKPSKVAYNKYIYTMRKAILVSDDAFASSSRLRNYFIDKEIDTLVSKKALKYFNDAEEEFGKKNYDNAAKLYKRAIDEQPDFYKAFLYLGDCFYFTGNYVDAISSFKHATEKFPFLLEPRKYLIDSYVKQHLYSEALNESIYAMAVYPDQSIVIKLEDAAYQNNKKINFKWTPRNVFPNKIIADSAKANLNEYKNPKEPIAKQPWTFYQNALPLIKNFCDKQGLIIKPNSLTKSKYLEIYSWEEMLKNSTDPILEEARKMQKDGYLDCYVMVTCYHFDFYDQYNDFVSKNRDKVIEYYKKYLVTR
jgi:tetratricopeptide (TPR) repeat protein